MNPLSALTRGAALCLATVFVIGAATALHTLATDGTAADAPTRAPTGTEPETDWELNPRRPC